MLQTMSLYSEGCKLEQDGEDEERILSTPSREMGVCDGVRQVEVRSGV